MTITLNGTTGIVNNATDLNYTGTLTGGTGVVNLGSGQVYKDASGNVGIGTSSPVCKFDFGASAAISGTAGLPSVAIYSSGTERYGFNLSANSLDISALSTNGTVRFYTGGSTGSITERARIDSSGNLLVGTTSAGPAIASGFAFSPQGTTNNYMAIGHASGTPSGNGYAVFVYNSSIIGSITQNGTTGVLYNLTSDYRLKDNPTPLTGAKDFVMALQPKTWDWWDGSGKGVGFIAHEFMEVAKYSGNGEKDAVDENGKPVYQSIQPSSSEVMANLVAFIQELKAELDTVKAELAALKGA